MRFLSVSCVCVCVCVCARAHGTWCVRLMAVGLVPWRFHSAFLSCNLKKETREEKQRNNGERKRKKAQTQEGRGVCLFLHPLPIICLFSLPLEYNPLSPDLQIMPRCSHSNSLATMSVKCPLAHFPLSAWPHFLFCSLRPCTYYTHMIVLQKSHNYRTFHRFKASLSFSPL